ncbi:MAG: tyrosine-type recombinase/integrase [Gammaproteobacteria bacterium]
MQEIEVSEDLTPPEVIRESRGIAFQSTEDQQYLRFSWNRLRMDEELELMAAVTIKLSSNSFKDRLLATLTVIAATCRRSMNTLGDMPLGNVTSEDWQLDHIGGVLHRFPSRRSVRWKAGDEAKQWVKPLCESWRLLLAPVIQDVLQEARKHKPNARNISDLWPDSSTSLKTAFNEWCENTPSLVRVTSGLLVRVAEQQAFEQSHDPIFSRLLTSPPLGAIPGAGAYPSWPLNKVAQTLTTFVAPFVVQSTTDIDNNALGSELDPYDSMLSQAFNESYEKVLALAKQKNQWVEYHNHLVGYTVAVLLAATGARPVSAVFESSAHFDLIDGCVYVEDKVSPMSRDGCAGRIIPIPEEIVLFLRDVYLPYLKEFALKIRSGLPDLSEEIAKQGAGLGSTKIPLFFFVRNRPDFEWRAVTESTLDQLELFAWPLPWNLFRHRLSVRLRALSLDPELIDAQLGHAETASETFGDYSTRCWAEDIQEWKLAITAAFNLLEIELPNLEEIHPLDLQVASGYQPFPEEKYFGKEARLKHRKKQQDQARQQAEVEIQAFVGIRPIESITSIEWEKLGRQMLLRETNLPQANASIRYQTYERYLQKLWRETGQRPRLRKWLAHIPKPKNGFHADAIGITSRLRPVRAALDNVYAKLQFSTTSKTLCALLAALDLCLEGKVTDMKVLKAVSQGNAKELQLVIFKRKLYIEHSEILTEYDRVPVTRFLLPTRSAKLIDRALNAGKQLSSGKNLPNLLINVFRETGLASAGSADFEGTLKKLATWVDLENSLAMPGVISAVLAGRVCSYALHHNDWIRVHTGFAPRDPSAVAPLKTDVDAALEAFPSPKYPIGLVGGDDREKTKNANRQLISDVRGVLLQYIGSAGISETAPTKAIKPVSVRKKATATNTETQSRRDARAAIETLLVRCDPAVCVAVHALASWTLHLLTRPYKKGLLDAASIKRYLDALSFGFSSYGYDIDLADLDADDLTEFYMRVIDPSVLTDEDKGEIDDESIISNDGPRKRNQKYVFQRLREFHQFADRKYGLETPDWSEIGEGLTGVTASPGFISEAEYLYALKLLSGQPNTDPPQAVRDAFVLLLSYRFGFRGGEAIGLGRNEWVNAAGTVVVLVTNKYRKLKTRASQRQIPLTEYLSDHEAMIVQRWLSYWEAETNSNQAVPLFFDKPDQSRMASMTGIRPRIITALRQSTRADHINLHHARHSFGNRIGLRILPSAALDIWNSMAACEDLTRTQTRAALLNSNKVTRRAPWAIARLLGHASPSTTFGSYIHFLSDWSSALIFKSSPLRFEDVLDRELVTVSNLDLWERDSQYLIAIQHTPETIKVDLTPAHAMKYFRLRAQGMTPATARQYLRLERDDAGRIEDALIAVGKKLGIAEAENEAHVSQIMHPLKLLGRIQKNRWQELLKTAEGARSNSASQNISVDDVISMVGKSRQLLLWKKDHFRLLQDFFQRIDLNISDIIFYRPKKLDTRTIEWAVAYGFTNLRLTETVDKKKQFQIDTAIEYREDQAPATFADRIAAVRSDKNIKALDNWELIVLWLTVSLGQA